MNKQLLLGLQCLLVLPKQALIPAACGKKQAARAELVSRGRHLPSHQVYESMSNCFTLPGFRRALRVKVQSSRKSRLSCIVASLISRVCLQAAGVPGDPATFGTGRLQHWSKSLVWNVSVATWWWVTPMAGSASGLNTQLPPCQLLSSNTHTKGLMQPGVSRAALEGLCVKSGCPRIT